jgi:hypothetical protein
LSFGTSGAFVVRAVDPSKSLTIDNLFRGKVQVSEEGY